MSRGAVNMLGSGKSQEIVDITFMALPTTVMRFLVSSILLLQGLNIVSVFLKYYYDGKYYRVTEYFDVGIEHNVPTIYSTTQLIFAGFCALSIFKVLRFQGLRDAGYWFFLGIVLIFLGLDEGATIHEMIGGHFHDRFERGGYLYWLWVVPYGVLTAWVRRGLLPFFDAPSEKDSARSDFVRSDICRWGHRGRNDQCGRI